jgi:hypothetical protein
VKIKSCVFPYSTYSKNPIDKSLIDQLLINSYVDITWMV